MKTLRTLALALAALLTASLSVGALGAERGDSTPLHKTPNRGLCAHRGTLRNGPENTLEAFKMAAEAKAGQIELDVRVSKDGALIVMHDDSVNRTTNGKGKVAELTLAEIKSFDAGVKFGEAFKGAKVPTFEEALAVMPRDTWINVHYYGPVEAVAKVVAVIVEQKRLDRAFLATSKENILAARAVEPDILTCNMSRQGNDSKAYVDLTLELKTEFIQLVKGVYTAEDIARLKAAGVRINCFGTNDPEEVKRMWSEGIDFPLVDDLSLFKLVEERKLATQVDRAWAVAWRNFYSPQTKLFYDFIESREVGKTLDLLPTEDEVARLYPNECGYGTAMEDCAISGGVMLTALVDRFANTGDETLKAKARDVFEGLELLTTVSGSSGFVARGVSPKAPKSWYINSSRDQVTHLALAVWEYWRSPLSDDETKERAAKILFAIADRMTRNVVPENDFDFLCSDGTRCRRGICRMANVDDHEAARLPALYAVAWDVAKRSGNDGKADEYWALWRRWAPETVAQSAHIRENVKLQNSVATYALLQMQESLDVLWRLEPDAELKKTLAETTDFVAKLAAKRQNGALQTLKNRDLTQLAPSWREVGGLVGDYRNTWYAPRACGELALTQALDSANAASFNAESERVLREALETPDFDQISSCGVFHLIGAYEKARRRGFLGGEAK